MGGEHIFQYPSAYGSPGYYLSYLTSRKAWLRGDQRDLVSIPKNIPLRSYISSQDLSSTLLMFYKFSIMI